MSRYTVAGLAEWLLLLLSALLPSRFDSHECCTVSNFLHTFAIKESAKLVNLRKSEENASSMTFGAVKM